MPTRQRDRELEAGALAHFDDPAYYDASYEDRTDDVAYYVQLAQKRGRVLEYGVGNGRIALPIARTGASLVGIDHSRPMVEDLKRRLKEEPAEVRKRVVVKRADMRTASLGERFPLVICPFNTAQHLYERADMEAWLARVTEHLEPRGELVLDVTMPALGDLMRDPAKAYRTPSFTHPSAGRVNYREHFDYDPVRQVLFVSMVFEPVARPDETFMTPLAHRQFFPRELEALLHYNGFETTAVYGDFERGALDKTSDVMVWHAWRRP